MPFAGFGPASRAGTGRPAASRELLQIQENSHDFIAYLSQFMSQSRS